MIATIEGDLVYKETDYIVVSVSGIGLQVFASFNTIESISSTRVFLFTRLVIGRDTITLFGFGSKAERKMFDALQNVTRVGPKLALTILSTLSIENIRGAVLNNRAEIIRRVPGVGEKAAQRIVLELQDKIPSGFGISPELGEEDFTADVLDALTALGYSVVEAQAAIQSIPLDAPDDVEERVRIALQSLSA